MKFNLYTIFDRIAEESGDIFQAVNHEVARRAVFLALKDVISIDDYDLVCVGHYDTSTMLIRADESEGYPYRVDFIERYFKMKDEYSSRFDPEDIQREVDSEVAI